MLLNFDMSWPKACLGTAVDWIGAHFRYDGVGVHVGIPEKRVADLTKEIGEHLSSGAMSLKRAGRRWVYRGHYPLVEALCSGNLGCSGHCPQGGRQF